MKYTHFNKTTSFVIFFTSLLTFFLLWVFYADKVKDLYVKNVLESNEKNLISHETLDVFWRKDLNLENFWDAYNIIRWNYYSATETEKVRLENWAIKWLVDSLWDIHSEFLDTDETKQFNAVLSWDFEWIGAVIDKVDLWIMVERILKWSPAKEFWVRNGDIILEANGIDLKNMWVYEAVEKIKWPAGTDVVLKILRAWEKDFLEIKVTRQKIILPSVETEIFEETNDFYIAVNMFGDNTVEEFTKALRESESYEGLVIDLRDNGWWYLDSAVSMLSEFIEDGKVLVTTKYKESKNNYSYNSRNTGNVYDKNVVILINGNSASASEIMAWALRDYNKTILVWEKSYGKWSVQQPFEFDDGGLLKITIAKWYTPNDQSIDGVGIEPDIEIEFLDEDYENEFDRQKEEALKVLQIYKEYNGIGMTIDKYRESIEVTATGSLN